MKNFYLIYGNDLGITNKYINDIKDKLGIKLPESITSDSKYTEI